jgi:threonine dehydrogenase-like Zn-dependent dehydrogenase
VKAVVIDGQAQLVDIPVTELEDGMVRVKVSMAAISGLDLDVIDGRLEFPGVPGNAFVGEVEDARGARAKQWIGQRVLARSSHGCGDCEVCQNAQEHLCLDRVMPGRLGASGGHAETVVLPAHAVARVPATVSDEKAVLAPMLAGVYSGVLRADLPEWTNVLVIGDGGAGLVASIALADAGYTVTVRGKHGDRFDLLRRHNINFNLVHDDVEIDGLRPGRFGPALMSYPYVVEASGHSSGWNAAAGLVAPGGTVMLMSSCCDGVPRSVARVQEKNFRVVGLREGPLEMALNVLEQDLFDPSEIVSSVVDFQNAMDAYRRARGSEDWLVLLRMRD